MVFLKIRAWPEANPRYLNDIVVREDWCVCNRQAELFSGPDCDSLSQQKAGAFVYDLTLVLLWSLVNTLHDSHADQQASAILLACVRTCSTALVD